MKVYCIDTFSQTNEEVKKLYYAFLNAQYFDLFDVLELHKKYPDQVRENMLSNGKFHLASDLDQVNYIRTIGKARMKACEAMNKLPIGFKTPIEYFEEYDSIKENPLTEEIIEEYRYQKKLGYAILS